MIQVTCAIIENDGKVLCAQRGPTMSMPLKWEFPGGKLESGETPIQCLRREVEEELGLSISIIEPLPPARHRYATFEIELIPFRCSMLGGELSLLEHAQIVWLRPDELSGLDWAAADIPIVKHYVEQVL